MRTLHRMGRLPCASIGVLCTVAWVAVGATWAGSAPANPARLFDVQLVKLGEQALDQGEVTSLGAVVRALAKSHREILVYIWLADQAYPVGPGPERDEYVPWSAIAELQALHHYIQEHSKSAVSAVSVVILAARDGDNAGQWHQSTANEVWEKLGHAGVGLRAYAYAAFKFDIAREAARAIGRRPDDYYLPELLVVDTQKLTVEGARGGDPAEVATWLRSRHARGPEHIEGVPEDSRRSWFARSIQMVIDNKVWPLEREKFEPHREVTVREFANALRNINRDYASPPYIQGQIDHEPLDRERALAIAARALYGPDPAKAREALDELWPPGGEQLESGMEEVALAWERAFGHFTGAEAASSREDMRHYLVMALADGLMYAQPSLRAKWPLTREEAAWLLGRLLIDTKAPFTGVLFHAPHLDLPDGQASQTVRIAYKGQDGKLVTLYPQDYAAARVPGPARTYDAQALENGKSLASAAAFFQVLPCADTSTSRVHRRVGHKPLVVQARRDNPRSRSRMTTLVIDSDDADRIKAANTKWGLLDYWRVAILTAPGPSSGGPGDVRAEWPGAPAVSVSLSPDGVTESAAAPTAYQPGEETPQRPSGDMPSEVVTPGGLGGAPTPRPGDHAPPTQPLARPAEVEVILSDRSAEVGGSLKITFRVKNEQGVELQDHEPVRLMIRQDPDESGKARLTLPRTVTVEGGGQSTQFHAIAPGVVHLRVVSEDDFVKVTGGDYDLGSFSVSVRRPPRAREDGRHWCGLIVHPARGDGYRVALCARRVLGSLDYGLAKDGELADVLGADPRGGAGRSEALLDLHAWRAVELLDLDELFVLRLEQRSGGGYSLRGEMWSRHLGEEGGQVAKRRSLGVVELEDGASIRDEHLRQLLKPAVELVRKLRPDGG